MSRIRIILCVCLGLAGGGTLSGQLPEPQRMTRSVGFAEMAAFLKGIARPGFITVSEEGRSHEGRSILSVRIRKGDSAGAFRVLLYAQQHGDEVSGKDAQLLLIQRFAQHPEMFPEDLDLTLMPMLNPDGAVAGRRSNGVKADLNRDHLRLAQPETRALYAVARRVMPHLAVDSHEFQRDPEEYLRKGWVRWPIITLDTHNHPLIPEPLRSLGLQVLAEAHPVMARAGFPFERYAVGGPPPDEEIRPSTPEVDDGRNGMGSHGALSFIVEAGVRRTLRDPEADLGTRVQAYLALYAHLLGTPELRARIRGVVEEARHTPLPPFIVTNIFWANPGGRLGAVKVLEARSGKALEVPTLMAMDTLVVKGAVPTPKAYAIEAQAAAHFRPLLEAHGLTYRELPAPERAASEVCTLVRHEGPVDEIHQRHADRQVVRRETRRERNLPAGTLMVPLDQPLARRAIEVLEPCLLYGLYSYPEFRALAQADGTLPVLRVF